MGKLIKAVGLKDYLKVEQILGEEEFTFDRTLIDKETDERGYNALYIAVMFGSEAIIELLLNEGAEVNQVFKDGKTPLHAAVFFERPNAVKALLGRSTIKVNSRNDQGHTPLYVATNTNRVNLEIVLALLAGGADCNAKAKDGTTPLEMAEKKGNTELVKLFKTNMSKNIILNRLSLQPQDSEKDSFSGREEESLPLTNEDFAEKTDSTFLPLSLSYPSYIDKLTEAIKWGNIEQVVEICNKKIDINKSDSKHRFPLLVALKELIDQEYRLGIMEYDEADETIGDLTSSVDEEEYSRRIEIVKLLLCQGASVLQKDDEGLTATDFAHKLRRNKLPFIEEIVKKHKKIELLREKFINLKNSIELEFSDIEKVDSFFMKQYCLNVRGSTEEFEEDLNDIKEMLEAIKNKKYIKWPLLKIYEILKIIQNNILKITQNNNYAFKLNIEEICDSQYIKEDENNYYYTFMNDKLYRLTMIDKRAEQNSNEDAILKNIIYQLITTLTYEGKRHSWEFVSLHHKLISKLNNKYSEFNLVEEYEKELNEIEKVEGDYFGEHLSDNSDSEEEKKYKALPLRERRLFFQYAERLVSRAQTDCLTTKKGELRKSGKSKKPPKIHYDTHKRQEIIREEELSSQVKHDLETLNYFVSDGNLNNVTIEQISTKFYIAQYRGICYRLDEWNKTSRKLHRKEDEIGDPLFSRAILKEAGYGTFHEYLKEKNKDTTKFLTEKSVNLQDQLIQLKKAGPVNVCLIGDEKRRFDNALVSLQDLYTKDYKKFHSFLKKNNFEEPIERAILSSVNNHYNFFVSTSDVPDHALRYAYGQKYYGAYNKKFRLRPRWNKSGRPERPYSGKVYISLHEPLELIDKSHHVVSLHEQSTIAISLEILSERETSFFGYIPRDCVVSQHIAKFPSFHGDYKEIYLKKYGLDRKLYSQFKDAILKSPPHSEERKWFTNLLTQHLISYQEICLIEEAKIAAKERGGILIYRNRYGRFSLIPCRFNDITRTTDTKLQLASTKKFEAKKEKQEKRKIKNEEIDQDQSLGFISKLSNQFTINETGNLTNILSNLLGKSVEEIEKLANGIKEENKWEKQDIFLKEKSKDIINFYNYSYTLLKLIAQKYKVVFRVYNPLLRKVIGEYQEIKDTNSSDNILNLYFVGGQKFISLVAQNKLKNNKDLESNSLEIYQQELGIFSSDLSNNTDLSENEKINVSTSRKRKAEEMENILSLSSLDSPLLARQHKESSFIIASKPAIIGPRSIPGWELKDVKDEGNCFYEAVAHQLTLIHHPYVKGVPIGTELQASLRLLVQGKAFKDYEWAEDKQIEGLVSKLDLVLAIIDTCYPKGGYSYRYKDSGNEIAISRDKSDVPTGKQIIKLAATGNHFLSVVKEGELSETQEKSLTFLYHSSPLSEKRFRKELKNESEEKKTKNAYNLT